MFHTSLITKNLLVCLVAFSFTWGFSEVTSTNNLRACIIPEDEENPDPEEDEDEIVDAKLVERQYRRQLWLGMSDWATEFGGRDLVSHPFFIQKNGKATLETKCKAKCTVPPGHFKHLFKIYVNVYDQNNNEIPAHRAESAWKELLQGETFVDGPEVSVLNYPGDSMTVVYRVVKKVDAPLALEIQTDTWTVHFYKF